MTFGDRLIYIHARDTIGFGHDRYFRGIPVLLVLRWANCATERTHPTVYDVGRVGKSQGVAAHLVWSGRAIEGYLAEAFPPPVEQDVDPTYRRQ